MYSGSYVNDERANGLAYAAIEGFTVVGFVIQDAVFGTGCANGGNYRSRLFVFRKEGIAFSFHASFVLLHMPSLISTLIIHLSFLGYSYINKAITGSRLL